MSQQSVEMILVRQLAEYLFVPVVVVDTAGTVIFYNEPAERILGVRFEETGRIAPEEADRLIELSEDPTAGPDDTGPPLLIALQQRRPAHAVGRDLHGPCRSQNIATAPSMRSSWSMTGNTVSST